LRAAIKKYLPALTCATTLLVCYFVIRPYAEIGIGDDFSYIKTAQVLAQTGHIAYNGFATAMLGWQLYSGALFIKLFGFSFTIVRLSTLIEAMATAFLLERTLERAGLNAWNAALATIVFVLSPLFIPFAYTFMTDVSGVLCILLCFYMCLRAVEAESERSAMVWISLAALVNAVGGTARQIAWLGVLVMVPSTLWLLRKSRRVLVAGSLSCVAGAIFVAAAMQWFGRQPYSLPEPLFPIVIGWRSAKLLAGVGLLGTGLLALLALPVLLAFAGLLRSWNRRMAAVIAIGLSCFAGLGMILICAGRLRVGLARFIGYYMADSVYGWLFAAAADQTEFSFAKNTLVFLLAGAVLVGILSLVTCFVPNTHRHSASWQTKNMLSWQKLGVMLGPFSAAYIVVLGLNEMRNQIFVDRYLLPLLLILLLVLARAYQERVKASLPWACAFLTIIFCGFGVVATHDTFAAYRGWVTAIDEVRSMGVPATAIMGSAEFMGWTQIEASGYVNDSRIQVPAGAYKAPRPRPLPEGCDPPSASFLDWTPAIKPVYGVFADAETCGGQAAITPVMFHTWIAPHTHWVYGV